MLKFANEAQMRSHNNNPILRSRAWRRWVAFWRNSQKRLMWGWLKKGDPNRWSQLYEVGEISRKHRTMRSLFLEGVLWDMANRGREDMGDRCWRWVTGSRKAQLESSFYLPCPRKPMKDFKQRKTWQCKIILWSSFINGGRHFQLDQPPVFPLPLTPLETPASLCPWS